jgi:hypothetical protein
MASDDGPAGKQLTETRDIVTKEQVLLRDIYVELADAKTALDAKRHAGGETLHAFFQLFGPRIRECLGCEDAAAVRAWNPVEPTARITEMNFKAKEGEPFEATGQFQGDAVKEWALVMVQWFREKGGINYVACDLSDPTTGERFEITMQKAGGRTPAQDLAEMRAELNALNRPAGTK